MNAPIFPTVLASCVKKPASTVFHPTLSLSQFLKQAKILFLPITNAKKKTGLALLPPISKKGNRVLQVLHSVVLVMVFLLNYLYDFVQSIQARHVATE